jgi:hypothetical protein
MITNLVSYRKNGGLAIVIGPYSSINHASVHSTNNNFYLSAFETVVSISKAFTVS